MRGFQLWLNLPSKEKMNPAQYRDIPAREIPVIELPSGGKVKVIAGAYSSDGKITEGPVNHAGARLTTDASYLDVHLPAGGQLLDRAVAAGHSAFLYAYEGSADIGAPGSTKALPHRAAGVLSDGDTVRVVAKDSGARFLVLAAKPLREPVVQYGPFVMNTREEIEQAPLTAYRDAWPRERIPPSRPALQDRLTRGTLGNACRICSGAADL